MLVCGGGGRRGGRRDGGAVVVEVVARGREAVAGANWEVFGGARQWVRTRHGLVGLP